jgi:hypothetical protein
MFCIELPASAAETSNKEDFMNRTLLNRLAALEARHAPPPAVEIDTRDVRRSLDLICERRRAQAGYRPCGVGVAVLIEAARAAERAARCA